MAKKLDIPILYLSKYINQNRAKYYECLNAAQQDLSELQGFLLFMIRGVYEMSEFTLNFIHSFIKTMNDAGNLIKERCPKIYSQELIYICFIIFIRKMNTCVKN